ncbi:hypothetical protein [Burkholderia stagnalis]|uniref:XRE family transcriptional regulator n=1 Tax=Burkholderia stagnalis TaxID=1503054 RepID=A0A108EUN0_9BURK|nr:hypothetical protein [Burkholderia stagnalis]KVC52300.1 hypothetical protein WS59_33255 [Burkholderia stagnalis]KVN17480.1 hypothetical protein WT10_03460 [Burkholderia stagnalis]KVO56584.1 hypothetical protein WT18_20335 [Burkholderia stagnalis]KVP13882.1 hypothetical protein WT20_07095 [Burkholderia stagnalis]KVW93859.1 hypothetical protein WT30_18930 [Burkholderia stagnalis]
MTTFQPLPESCVNWNEVFVQLRRAGYSVLDIEHFTGIRHSTFMGWKNGGAQPNHPNGERMIAFWSQALAMSRDMLPMRPMEYSAAKIARPRHRSRS